MKHSENWYAKTDAQRGREALGCLGFLAVIAVVVAVVVVLIVLATS